MEKARIFVVEDESIVARDIMDSLTSMGHDVLGMSVSGEDAIEKVGKLNPDLVLMDIVLQGPLDGIQSAERIRSQYGIPVIYLTAYADETILNRAKLTEPYGYLIKPFEEKELQFSIDMGLYKHRMETQLKRSNEQLRRLLETARAVPWEVDPETGEFAYLGPQLSAVLGVQGRAWPTVEALVESLSPEQREEVRRFFSAHTFRNDEIEFQLAIDGSVRWIRNIVSYQDESGRLRGFMMDVTARKQAELDREKYIEELTAALHRIQTLQGLLPICAWCKKIRDDKGYWKQVEIYIEEHSEAEFTHSMCPECKKNLEAELAEREDLRD